MSDKKSSEFIEKRLVTTNFLKAVDDAIRAGVVKNVSDFAGRINEPTTAFSEMKRSRGVTVNQLLKSVNTFDFNANYFFRLESAPKEPLFKNGNTTTYTNGSGNQQVLSGNRNNITNMVTGGNNNFYNNVDRIFQLLPHKEGMEIKQYFDLMMERSNAMAEKILVLKKMIENRDEEIKSKNQEISLKDQKLMETQERLINFLMEKNK